LVIYAGKELKLSLLLAAS